MKTIGDDELVLYYYRDGLDVARRAEIAATLAKDARLSQRLARLRSVLDAAALDRAPEPDSGLSARIADAVLHRAGVEDRQTTPGQAMPAAAAPTRPPRRFGRRQLSLRWLGGALAASLLLGVGFYAGQHSAPPAPPWAIEPHVVSAERIYRATMANHLGSTQRLLLTAVNGDERVLAEGNAAVARALLDEHRLYLAVAQRRGDRRLAVLLQELEPILIELANPSSGGDISSRKGLEGFVEHQDLIFQVRAAEAGLTARSTTRT